MAKERRPPNLKKKLLKARTAYEGFMERQGFYVVLALCVVTIVATAVFTNNNPKAIVTPPPQQGLLAAADDDTVQRLEDAATPTPAPTSAMPMFVYPVWGNATVYRAFDGARPVYYEATNHWQIHKAIDIRTSYGQSVLAVADGKVIAITEGTSDGVMLVISHPNGYESHYKGLLNAAALAVGDPVSAGQTIGNAGLGPLIENGDGAHVHLEIFKDGIAINPSDLF